MLHPHAAKLIASPRPSSQTRQKTARN